MIDRQNDQLIERLRIAGLRVTSPRLAVLEALGTRSHVDADTIATAARQRLGTLSAQAVYDILRAFGDAGLVRRIEPAGSPAVYETRVGDNHHHIVCRICGSIADVDCVIDAAPCLAPSTASGYIVDEAEITFWGICPECQRLRKENIHE